jgi:hypothetical protein
MLTLQHMARQHWGERTLEMPAVPEGWTFRFIDESGGELAASDAGGRSGDRG